MTDKPLLPTVAAVVLQADDPADLHTLAQAMDNIVMQTREFTPEEMLAVIRLAAPIVGRFIMLRGALADEVLRLELDEAEPEGHA